MYTVKIGNGQKLPTFSEYTEAYKYAKNKYQQTGKTAYIYDDGRYGTEHKLIYTIKE